MIQNKISSVIGRNFCINNMKIYNIYVKINWLINSPFINLKIYFQLAKIESLKNIIMLQLFLRFKLWINKLHIIRTFFLIIFFFYLIKL